MLRAIAIVRKPAVKKDRIADTAWLDHGARQSRETPVKSHAGIEFSLDFDKATTLNDGDAVKLEDGRLVQVKAVSERLLEIRAENPARLMRFAWQLGQRHAPAELSGEAIYIEDDAGLAELARGQGCRVTPVSRPFHPERADEHACEHHDHGHGGHHHGHDHSDHTHAHAGHGHGAACNHGHKHEH